MTETEFLSVQGAKLMYPPVDYPLKASQEKASQEEVKEVAEITYAALLDRYNSEQPITNDMIQQACQKMDEAQQYPFSTSAEDSGESSSEGPGESPDKSGDLIALNSGTVAQVAAPLTTASNALLGRLKNIIT